MEEPNGRERRRGARIKSKFWVKIPNIAEETELRPGDISISGIFLEIDRPLGKTGDVHALNIAASDRSDSICIMARLVRMITIDDIWREKVVTGAAWEFLFENDQQRRNIEQFVRNVAMLQKMEQGDLELAYHYNAKVGQEDSATHAALVTSVWLNGMLIETDWPVTEGEKLNVEIEAPASKKKMSLVGQARTTRRLKHGDSGRYQVEVRFVVPETATSHASSDTIANAVDQLLTETAVWPPSVPARAHEHLKGNLAQIRIPSLLAFIELERMSGVVRVKQDSQCAKLFVNDGRVIDAVAGEDWSVNPLELLTSLMRWNKGVFEFRLDEVDRKDRIEMSTSALLIELARREDEFHC